jgi:hypothetical protein
MRENKVPSRAQSSTGLGSRRLSSQVGLSGNVPGSNSSSSTAVFRLSGTSGDIRSNKNHTLRRCDSAVAGGLTGLSPSDSSVPGTNNSSSLKKQGTDYLVEIDGKVLSIYGQGALKHTLTVQRTLSFILYLCMNDRMIKIAHTIVPL